jgi:YbbR domain-containing protein
MAWHPFRNIGLKLAALGLGVLLWVTISGQQVERNVLVQLQFRNIPANLELSGDAPRTVDVRLSGAAGLIGGLEPYQVVATIDLINSRPGLKIFPLTNDQISVPLGVEVKSVEPSTIYLELERSATAQVPVEPTIDGEPAAGFQVAEVTWEPRTVEAVGPESRMRDPPSAVTERISIEGARATITESVSLGFTDSAVRLSRTQPVRVTITIGPGPVARFADRSVTFRDSPQGRRVLSQPAAVSVTVRAAQDVLRRLVGSQIEPYVDVGGLGPGRYDGIQVRVAPSDDYLVVAIEPSTVSVRIQ